MTLMASLPARDKPEVHLEHLVESEDDGGGSRRKGMEQTSSTVCFRGILASAHWGTWQIISVRQSGAELRNFYFNRTCGCKC